MAPPPPAELGEVIAGYRLDSVLGHGGMAWVFAGTHVALGRRAAIKVLGSPYADDESHVSRFFSEAKVVNDIRHPNIVDIIDFAETSNPRRVAYVMEFLSGPALSDIPRLSMRQAINICLQLSHALQAVHEVHVVHRDLKPENVILIGSLETDLSMTPSVKLVDFGIAKIEDPSASHKTATGQVLGTPSFMAPEQVAGEPVSAATDVYALGEILYEVVSGKRLFVGTTPAVLKQKILGELPLLELEADVPRRRELEGLILACLSFDPLRRPSMKEVWQTLVGLLETLPPHARSSVPTPPRASWAPPGPAGPGAGGERTLDFPAEPMLGDPASTSSLSKALADDIVISRPMPKGLKLAIAGGVALVLIGGLVLSASTKSTSHAETSPTLEPARPANVAIDEAPDPEPVDARKPEEPTPAADPEPTPTPTPVASKPAPQKVKKEIRTKKKAVERKKPKKKQDAIEKKLDESIEALTDPQSFLYRPKKRASRSRGP
ncbi:MAG: serine/threonine protein kinase [Deltaproteobacteria bacterium]|nr:serine/threonine protein kinase [Deltaproteobacteria bacterium]